MKRVFYASVLIFLVQLLPIGLLAQTAPVSPASAIRSVSDVLRPDGSLQPGTSGSFDAKGYQLNYGPKGQPKFQKAGEETGGWDPRFSLPGLNGIVRTIAVSGNDVYIGGEFTDAGGFGAADRIVKWNGEYWQALGSGLNATVRAIAVLGTDVYVGGGFTSAAGSAISSYLAKWDGTGWQAVGAGLNGGVSALAVSGSDLYVGGNFTKVGGNASIQYLARWDGAQWHPIGTGTGITSDVFALAVAGKDLYVGGRFTNASGIAEADYIAKWDGTSWSKVGSPLDSWVLTIALVGEELYIGGNFIQPFRDNPASYVARLRGGQWQGLISATGAGVGAPVNALAVVGTDLYVGGLFSSAGGVNGTKGLAKWTGTEWQSSGGGTSYRVYALGVMNKSVFVGGDFTSLNPFPLEPTTATYTNNIVRWDGTQWHQVGGQGLNNYVYAITVSGTDVYIGGEFKRAGDVAAHRVARWDGSRWHMLPTAPGQAFDDVVTELAVIGKDLYAGGQFNTPYPGMARWDGTQWHEVGTKQTTTSMAVAEFATRGSDLYVAGNFTIRLNATAVATHLARWDGTAWHAVGDKPLNKPVLALAVQSSSLYIGGSFTDAGGNVNADYIARWDGSAWQSLSTGMNAPVGVLAFMGTDLYAGGNFTRAGTNTTVKYIARWDGTSWQGLGKGLSSSVSALQVVGQQLYVGGNFSNVTSSAVGDGLARWDGKSWHEVGSGVSDAGNVGEGFVSALAASDSKLYVGGRFNRTGDGSVGMGRFGIYDLSGIPLAVEPEIHTPSTSMQLWPNPAQRVVHVAGLPTGQPLQFYDALGRLALTLAAPRDTAQVQLPPSLKPGVYIVRCGAATRRLIVK